jgi:drug/metabolite transporter (DMT)-like permease
VTSSPLGAVRAARGEAYPTLLIAFAVVVWGCTPRVTAVAGPHADPLTLTMLRAAPTAVVLLAALPLLRSRLPRDREAWLWTAVSGLLMVTVFLAGFTEAIIHAGPGNAVVLATTSPFWVVVLARIFLSEHPSLQAIGGLVLGFAGVVLIVSSQLGGDAGGAELAAGMGLALAAALGWAVGTLVVKQLLTRRPDVDAVGLTTGQFVVGGAVLVVIAVAAEGGSGADWSSGELWLAVAFISIVGCAVATLAYFGALRRLSATRVSAWLFLSPVIAVALEIVLGHTPSAVALAGMVVTIAGVAIVTSAAPATERRGLVEPVAVAAASPSAPSNT